MKSTPVADLLMKSARTPTTSSSHVVQSTNESPPLDAVQVIVKRLEAQATPGQVSSTAGTLPDPIHTVSPTRPKHSAGACCNAGGLQSTLDAAATTEAERLTNPCTTREAVAAPSHTAARSPPRSVNACSDGVARNDSSSCVGCREAQHELKTLTCKVAGVLPACVMHRSIVHRISLARMQRQWHWRCVRAGRPGGRVR